jgi:hypothetical protein
MTYKSKYTDEQWAEARRLHSRGLAFSGIAKRLGMHANALRQHAAKRGWVRAALPPAGLAGPRLTVSSMTPAAQRTRRALLQRLYGYMDLQLRTLEISMQTKLDVYAQSPGGEPPAPSDTECARFSELIDNINKVTEMAAEPALAADGRRKSASVNPELTALSDELDADAFAAASQKDELRREIAGELEKLGPPSASS